MPSRADIESQNEHLLKIQCNFRIAAEFVATSISSMDVVQKIALIGSVAKPLKKEIPRFQEYKKAGIAVWHECKDVDLAVWVNSLNNLESIRKAKVQGLKVATQEKKLRTASHQVEVFIMETDTNRYLGRLCDFNKCPKHKNNLDCMSQGCGIPPFLKQIPQFQFHPQSIAEDSSIVLFER